MPTLVLPKTAEYPRSEVKKGARYHIDLVAPSAMMLLGRLAPSCSRIELGGSLRRRRKDVADIEIVCVPTIAHSTDLLGDRLTDVNQLELTLADLLLDPTYDLALRLDEQGHTHYGPASKRLVYNGLPVDLFAVLPPKQWGPTMVLRTGPAAFNQQLVTQTTKGGWCPPSIYWLDGSLRRVGTATEGGGLIDTPEEADVFKALDLPYLRPALRTHTIAPRLRSAGVYLWCDRGRWIE